MTAPRCSQVAAAQGEPLPATAPLARTWVVLEQPGPYGRKALHDSHLPAAVGDAFAAATEGTAVTVLLARNAAAHPDRHRPDPHRFWIAHVSPGGARMRSGRVDDLHELVTGDLPEVMERAGRGELPAWGARSTEPVLAVCSNGRRDVCCAIGGRPVANALAADPAYSSHVIEVSHLGGHRFAPTALLLPAGMSYGRLTAESARSAVDDARKGSLALDGARGLTALARPMQAADLALRAAYGLSRPGELELLRVSPSGALAPAGLRWDGDGADELVVVGRRVDGRAWQVPVRRAVGPQARPESCGKRRVVGTWWVAGAPEALDPWL